MAQHDTHSVPSIGTPPDRAQTDALDVNEFFERYARALVEGDALTIAALWEAPAFVIDVEIARTVSSADEVEKFFSGARDQYNSRGITGTRAEITQVDWATDLMALVTVRWPLLDETGKEMGD